MARLTTATVATIATSREITRTVNQSGRRFGTPIHGMGFRISIEVARMSLDMVWAEIALAAIAGTAFYGIIALAERATTFWHPSYRT